MRIANCVTVHFNVCFVCGLYVFQEVCLVHLLLFSDLWIFSGPPATISILRTWKFI